MVMMKQKHRYILQGKPHFGNVRAREILSLWFRHVKVGWRVDAANYFKHQDNL